jgi:hypothetical protein
MVPLAGLKFKKADESMLMVTEEFEDFPGPNRLPTRSVFDLKLALSFNCQTRVCCCFITENCSVTSLLFRYGYIGH